MMDIFVWLFLLHEAMICDTFQIRCLSEDQKHNCSMRMGAETESAIVKKLHKDQKYRIQMAAITSHGFGEWSKVYIVGKCGTSCILLCVCVFFFILKYI